MKYIGIVGSRTRDSYKDYLLVLRTFEEIYQEGDIIVSGGCKKGGDRFAEKIARDKGLSILIHYPDWNKEGKKAGFVRNSKIVDSSDILIACVSTNRKGGTEDTVKKFSKNKYQLHIV